MEENFVAAKIHEKKKLQTIFSTLN